MSEYSELIKRFDKIRDYMRDFYVYGFMSRDDFKQKKSLRSYDNEKRRIESYLSDYMSFRMDENGKTVFLSVDSSDIPVNPLYRAFKAKTFTKNDITLNFIILDILYGRASLSVSEIADKIVSEYLCYFENPIVLDVSTIRNKLTEYVALGILTTEKQGKKLLYLLNDIEINSDSISDALMFFSEVSPLGVVGSYLLDKCNYDNTLLSYKHHYIMHALESEIVYELLKAIHNKQKVEIINHSARSVEPVTLEIIPLKFTVSVQGGRRYLAAFSFRSKAILSFRLDYIKSIKPMEACEDFDSHYERLSEILSNTWGASFGKGKNLEHLTMLLDIPRSERYIINRILREGRNGTLSKVDETTYQYEISVYDTTEMIPWLRTFIGRILSLECDNKAVVRTFYKDLNTLFSIYGGDTGAI
jgi:DNA-binding transcriptional ArsR family regulator